MTNFLKQERQCMAGPPVMEAHLHACRTYADFRKLGLRRSPLLGDLTTLGSYRPFR